MLLRRLILSLMLIALACCAIAGLGAVIFSRNDGLFSVIGASIAIAVAAGILLPLTMLVDRPNFRLVGITAMIVVFLMLLSFLVIFASNYVAFSSYPRWRFLEETGLEALSFSTFFGIPTVGAMLMVKFRWARIAPKFLAAVAAISFLIGMTSLVFPKSTRWYRPSEKLLLAAAATYGLGALAAILMVNVRCGDRRHFRFPGILALAVVWIITLSNIAYDSQLERSTIHIMVGLFVASIFFCHFNLLLMVPRRSRILTIATLALSAGCGILAFANDALETDAFLGVATAFGIASGSGSLAMVVLALSHRRFDFRANADRTLLTQIQLICPRCAKPQTLPLGNSDCIQCGLHLSIQATEPQCMECGYLLYGIAAPRCPECGAANPAGKSSPIPIAPAIAPGVAPALIHPAPAHASPPPQ